MIRIPVNEPDLSGNEQAYVLDAVRSGWISTGPYVRELERRFAEFTGTRHALTTTSGTAALQLAVSALGLGPGDEVLLPALTIVSAAFAVCHVGATPVLVDSEPASGNIDPGLIEAKVTARTRAIIPVHLYGHPADMDPIRDVARRHALRVVEDAAEAHGACYRGRRVGSLGDLGCFSLYANKLVTTGEGGIVTTDDDGLAERISRLKDLAHSAERRFVHTDMAYALRMTNLQAAVGVAQMERVEQFIARKRRMADGYRRALSGIEGLHLPAESPGAESVAWMYALRVTREFGCGRDELIRRLAERGVDTRTFFVPMHQQPVFRRMDLFAAERYPVAERLAEEGFYLPSGLTLRDEHIHYVAETVRAIQADARRG
ncbi:MAG TPA: DegT/DnrJ/EryC1/StrS family aminotransferase [Methylomirabilota bacterium]|jgi:perosamine synthetase|nr:DegT/DnrJ/EryC1/StrS family aminotransferase [Methylomirabilota bacterium]